MQNEWGKIEIIIKFRSENFKVLYHFRDLGTVGRIILNFISKKLFKFVYMCLNKSKECT